MCPACLATLSMIVAGVISTVGVTALAAKTILSRKNVRDLSGNGLIPAGKESDSPEEKEKRS